MYTITCTDETYPFSYEVESLKIEDVFDKDEKLFDILNDLTYEAMEIVNNPSLAPHWRCLSVIDHFKVILNNHFSNHIFYRVTDNNEESEKLYDVNLDEVGEYLSNFIYSCCESTFMDDFSTYWSIFLEKGSWHIDYDKEEIWFGIDTPKEGWVLSSTSTGIFFESENRLFPWRGVLQGTDEYYFIMWAFFEFGHREPEEEYCEVLNSCPVNLGHFTYYEICGSKVNKEQITANIKAFFENKKI